MKKILASIMALTLALSLAACGETETTPVSSENAPVSSQAPSSQAPSSQAPIDPPSEIPSEPAEESKNLALKGTGIADGVHPTYGGDIVNLNDDNTNTRWQSARDMVENGVQSEELAPWAGIYWDEAQTFDTLIFWFEASDPTEDGYKVFYAEEYVEDATEWTLLEGMTVSRGQGIEQEKGTADANDSTDTVTFEAITAKAIKIVGYTAENKNVTLSIWEIEVYNSADVEDETVSEEAAESTDETVAE